VDCAEIAQLRRIKHWWRRVDAFAVALPLSTAAATRPVAPIANCSLWWQQHCCT